MLRLCQKTSGFQVVELHANSQVGVCDKGETLCDFERIYWSEKEKKKQPLHANRSVSDENIIYASIFKR